MDIDALKQCRQIDRDGIGADLESGDLDRNPVRIMAAGNSLYGAGAAGAAQVQPEAIVRRDNPGPEELVTGSPMPVHGRIIQRCGREQRVLMILAERHTQRKLQCDVFAGRHRSDDAIVGAGRTVFAIALAVFEIDQRQPRLLPGRVRGQSYGVRFAVGINESRVGNIEPQVGQRHRAVRASQRLPGPGCYKRNFDGVLRWRAGAEYSERECGRQARYLLCRRTAERRRYRRAFLWPLHLLCQV